MLNLDHEIRVKNIGDWVRIYFFGDQHYGARDCAEGHMKQTIREIAETPNAYCILMGDSCDFVNYSDPRFDIRHIAPDLTDKVDNLPRTVADRFVDICKPLKGKIICMIPGNHDDKIRQKYHFDVAGYIAALLDVPIISQIAQIRIRVRDDTEVCTRDARSYMIAGVLSHAERGPVTLGGKIATALRMSDYYDGHDFFAQAHLHEYAVHSIPAMSIGGRFGDPRTIEKMKLLFLTGSYLKTYGEGSSGYGERKGYRPTRLGSPHLKARLRRTSRANGGRGGKSVDFLEIQGE